MRRSSASASLVMKKPQSMNIAVAAHISKASVFQYFGSKKQLYIYLLEYCKKIIEGLFDKEALDSETDLFDRILASSRMKMEGSKISLLSCSLLPVPGRKILPR